MNNETPETDAALTYYCDSDEECISPLVDKDFARKLERERNSLWELHNKNAARSAELLELCNTLRKERDEALKLLAQYSAEREHNAMQALAHKADADSMRDAIKVSLIRAYTAGYQHGHESTVDGGYIPVHHSEKTDFHAENIHQMLCDGSLPELQPFLND